MAKRKAKRKVKKAKNPRKYTHKNLPATVGQVDEVRLELKADIRALDKKMDSRFDNVDSKFKKVDSRFKKIESKMNQIEANTHRTLAIVEEMRSENRVVLDGLKNLWERQDRLESNHNDLRNEFELRTRKAGTPREN